MATATELETVSGCFGITRKVSSVDLVHSATAMGTAQIRKRSIQLQKKNNNFSNSRRVNKRELRRKILREKEIKLPERSNTPFFSLIAQLVKIASAEGKPPLV
jgi:hypothetical protein